MTSVAYNDCVALPRPSSFSPKLRIVAWADSTSVRRKLMYGSQGSLNEEYTGIICRRACVRPNSSRPQTIPYRPKSGVRSNDRPCSAPIMNKKRENMKVSTLTIALPKAISNAKPMYKLEPKIPPKKKMPWGGPEYLRQQSVVNMPHSPSPPSTQIWIDQRSYTSVGSRRTPRPHSSAGPRPAHGIPRGPTRDLHLSHRIAHLSQQINDCSEHNRASIVT